MLRALPDYDALFGVDFTPTPTQGELPAAATSEAPRHDHHRHDQNTTSTPDRTGSPPSWPT